MQYISRQSLGQPARCWPVMLADTDSCCLPVQQMTTLLDVQVTGAEAALRKMLPLVFSKEQGDCLLLHAYWACFARD